MRWVGNIQGDIPHPVPVRAPNLHNGLAKSVNRLLLSSEMAFHFTPEHSDVQCTPSTVALATLWRQLLWRTPLFIDRQWTVNGCLHYNPILHHPPLLFFFCFLSRSSFSGYQMNRNHQKFSNPFRFIRIFFVVGRCSL